MGIIEVGRSLRDHSKYNHIKPQNMLGGKGCVTDIAEFEVTNQDLILI